MAFEDFQKIAPPAEHEKMLRDYKLKCKPYQWCRKSRTCNTQMELDHSKLLSTLSLVFIVMCFLIALIQSELKVVRHTFEEGLDDWKVENQSWLRLPYSRLKKDHPNLPTPVQLNSTVRLVIQVQK